MQSRELPRIVTAEAQAREVLQDEEQPRRSRFTGLDFVRAPRRFDWLRLTLVCLMVGGGVGLIGYFGRVALQNAVAWLHAQPKYQLAFTDIQLVPPAPGWILGGDLAILQGVLKNSGEEPILSVPATDPKRLGKEFRKSPWVRDVREIRFGYPDQIVVDLMYRKPVAAVVPAEQKRIVLDEDGVILPDDEIDDDRVALADPSSRSENALILIQRAGQELPGDRSPGTRWKSNPLDVEPTESDRLIHSAARLAGFLDRKSAKAGPGLKALRIYKIYLNDEDPDRRGMVIYTFEKIRIVWGPAPGEEPVGNLTADEKWAMMTAWAHNRPRPSPTTRDEYWTFQKDGLKLVSPNS